MESSGFTKGKIVLAVFFGLLLSIPIIYVTSPHPVEVPRQIITPVPTQAPVIITVEPTVTVTPTADLNPTNTTSELVSMYAQTMCGPGFLAIAVLMIGLTLVTSNRVFIVMILISVSAMYFLGYVNYMLWLSSFGIAIWALLIPDLLFRRGGYD